jgi:hypothetical protein
MLDTDKIEMQVTSQNIDNALNCPLKSRPCLTISLKCVTFSLSTLNCFITLNEISVICIS